MFIDVSIIIPVFNTASYIEDCLRSVMRQTYGGPMECLVVDDCGTDESITIAERMIAAYGGPICFEILQHKTNRGLSAARNTGIIRAKGEYIYFLDSDDEITEDCIEKMMAIVMKIPAIELVQGKSMKQCDGIQTLGPKKIQIKHACTNDEVRNCFYQHHQVVVAAWNKLMKRSLIQQNHIFFIEGLLGEDTPWTFCWLKHVGNAYFIPDVTYHYKIRPDSIVTGTDEKTKTIHRIKGYHHIVTDLTLGYEQQELAYYVMPFVNVYCNEHNLPECRAVFRLFWKKAKHCKCCYAYIGLVIGYLRGVAKGIGKRLSTSGKHTIAACVLW